MLQVETTIWPESLSRARRHRGALSRLLGIGMLLAASVSWVGAPTQDSSDFQTPTIISEPGQVVTGFRTGRDFFENLTVVYESDGELLVRNGLGASSSRATLGPGAEPSMAFHSLETYVAYSGLDPATPGDLEILLAQRAGVRWNPPVRFSRSAGEDRFPSLQLQEGNTPVVAWEKRLHGLQPRVWFRRGAELGREVERGERPALVLDSEGVAHLFFLREGDVHYTREEAGGPALAFSEPIQLYSSPGGDASPPRAALDADGVIHLCFSQAGEVLLTSNATGEFSPPTALAGDGATRPDLVISVLGEMGVVFEKAGDIQLALGDTASLSPPVTAIEGPNAGSEPQILLDGSSTVSIVFTREGALYHTTDAEVPRADFTAEPTEGMAPLEVQFTDSSSGPLTSWHWDFGDGHTSSDRNPAHVFVRQGEYRVSLRVTGPGGDSPLQARQTIVVHKAPNELRLSNLRVFPGQENVYLPVLATHDQPAQGFTIVASYDPEVVDVKDVAVTNSNVAGLLPELFAVDISTDPKEPYVTAGMLFDVAIPIDGRVLPPGADTRIANIVLDIRPDAAPGSVSQVELENRLGDPPLSNIITVDGRTVKPALGEGGTIVIANLSFPPPRFFRRGDPDANGDVNITDCIMTLNYMFSGGEPPECHDAADANDDGVIDTSDPVFVLAFLFRAGTFLPAPYPDAGMDPTEDDLPTCTLRW